MVSSGVMVDNYMRTITSIGTSDSTALASLGCISLTSEVALAIVLAPSVALATRILLVRWLPLAGASVMVATGCL